MADVWRVVQLIKNMLKPSKNCSCYLAFTSPEAQFPPFSAQFLFPKSSLCNTYISVIIHRRSHFLASRQQIIDEVIRDAFKSNNFFPPRSERRNTAVPQQGRKRRGWASLRKMNMVFDPVIYVICCCSAGIQGIHTHTHTHKSNSDWFRQTWNWSGGGVTAAGSGSAQCRCMLG